jgi:fused signal recognition particle receptor
MFKFFKSFFSKKNIHSLKDIEDVLIQNDVGMTITHYFLDHLKNVPTDQIILTLKTLLLDILKPAQKKIDWSCSYFLICGQNGSGKTTTIAKMAKQALDHHKKVALIAGDTFRAAAQEQLKVWADRLKVDIFERPGQSPSSVIFDGCVWSKEHSYDVNFVDTAGRLHTKEDLMNELLKINRVMQKCVGSFETILVLDGTIGQNSYQQTKVFHETIGLTGIIMTKLDSQTKGGTLLSIVKDFSIPVVGLGVGETIDDLIDFNAQDMVDRLVADVNSCP